MNLFILFNSSFLTTNFFWKVKVVVDIDVLFIDGVMKRKTCLKVSVEVIEIGFLMGFVYLMQ